MFSTDQNITSLKELLIDVKEYLGLRYELLQLDFVSKATRFIAAILLGFVLLLLIGFVLLFLSLSAAQALSPFVGSLALAYLLIAIVFLIVAFGLYLLRRPLITRPLAKILCKIFLQPNKVKEDPK